MPAKQMHELYITRRCFDGKKIIAFTEHGSIVKGTNNHRQHKDGRNSTNYKTINAGCEGSVNRLNTITKLSILSILITKAAELNVRNGDGLTGRRWPGVVERRRDCWSGVGCLKFGSRHDLPINSPPRINASPKASTPTSTTPSSEIFRVTFLLPAGI